MDKWNIYSIWIFTYLLDKRIDVLYFMLRGLYVNVYKDYHLLMNVETAQHSATRIIIIIQNETPKYHNMCSNEIVLFLLLD